MSMTPCILCLLFKQPLQGGEPKVLPSALRPLLFALCPMPYALCP